MTGIYPAPILDKAGETQVNNLSIVIRRDTVWTAVVASDMLSVDSVECPG